MRTKARQSPYLPLTLLCFSITLYREILLRHLGSVINYLESSFAFFSRKSINSEKIWPEKILVKLNNSDIILMLRKIQQKEGIGSGTKETSVHVIRY